MSDNPFDHGADVEKPHPVLAVFNQIDTNKDHKISVDELGHYLETRNIDKFDPAYRLAFRALYMIANPGSREAVVEKMTLTEDKTAGLLYFLPSYRSDSLAAKDPYFKAESKDATAEPPMSFSSITGNASVMTYEQFARAAQSHEAYLAHAKANSLIAKISGCGAAGGSPVQKSDVKDHVDCAIDFDQFKSIYRAVISQR
jgi:hypothetical protein